MHFLPSECAANDLQGDATANISYYVSRQDPETDSVPWRESPEYPTDPTLRALPIYTDELEMNMLLIQDPDPEREIEAIVEMRSQNKTDGESFKNDRYFVTTTSTASISQLVAAANQAGASEDDELVHITLVHQPLSLVQKEQSEVYQNRAGLHANSTEAQSQKQGVMRMTKSELRRIAELPIDDQLKAYRLREQELQELQKTAQNKTKIVSEEAEIKKAKRLLKRELKKQSKEG